nr:unnamed protein product [Callosobruchus analis]
MGDLNINLMNGSSRGSALFTSMLESVGLNQIVTEATRITVITETLIDVICTSNLDRVVSCNVKSVDAMGDHELISCSLDLKKDTTPMTHTFRNYRNLDIDALTSELKSIPWQNLYDATDIDNKIDFFNSAISRLQDRHIPIVERTLKKAYSPWKTDNVMFLISLQNKARIKFKKSKSQTDFEHYKRIKNLTTSIIRLEKKSYMEQRIIKSPNNLWKSLNTLNMNSKLKKYEIPDTLHDVNFLNKYYINSVPKSNISVMNTVNQYMSRNASQLYDQFNFQLIDDIITLRHLTSIKSNSVGFDGIEIKFLKLCCPFLLPILTHIINYCLRLAVFPKEWKLSKIKPIPKNREPQTFKDLRPISILSAPSKILEKIVNEQLKTFLESNKIIPDEQYGFRKGRGCATALMNVTDNIITKSDRGGGNSSSTPRLY